MNLWSVACRHRLAELAGEVRGDDERLQRILGGGQRTLLGLGQVPWPPDG
jgi:hypothetical protein